jgi:hypothetical protein
MALLLLHQAMPKNLTEMACHYATIQCHINLHFLTEHKLKTNSNYPLSQNVVSTHRRSLSFMSPMHFKCIKAGAFRIKYLHDAQC